MSNTTTTTTIIEIKTQGAFDEIHARNVRKEMLVVLKELYKTYGPQLFELSDADIIKLLGLDTEIIVKQQKKRASPVKKEEDKIVIPKDDEEEEEEEEEKKPVTKVKLVKEEKEKKQVTKVKKDEIPKEIKTAMAKLSRTNKIEYILKGTELFDPEDTDNPKYQWENNKFEVIEYDD